MMNTAPSVDRIISYVERVIREAFESEKRNHMLHDATTTPEKVEALEITACNENLKACKKCGGRCCKSMGCEIYPQDVKRWFNSAVITEEMIVKLLDSGMVTLDWRDDDIREYFNYPEGSYEKLERCLYLHMRNKDEYAIQGSWGGTCRALTPTGCSIPWDKRPTGGKALIPSKTGDPKECNLVVTKHDCVLAWIPYEDILTKVFNEYDTGDPVVMLMRLLDRR